ncbi:MAG: hypothetical protein Q8P07_00800 [bacterium]|nr:hypothetical protein [bacterium]
MSRQDKEKKLLELLKNSLIPEKIKEIVRKNVKKVSDELLDGALTSMAREKIGLEKVATDLMKFDAESEARWDNLEIEQLKTADDFVENAFKELTG